MRPVTVMMFPEPDANKVPVAGVAPGKYAAQPVLVTPVWVAFTVPPHEPKFRLTELTVAVAFVKSTASSCGSLAIIGLAAPVVPISRILLCVRVPANVWGKKAKLAMPITRATTTTPNSGDVIFLKILSLLTYVNKL